MFKKIFISFVLLFIFAATYYHPEKMFAETQNKVKINSNVINIRTGPGFEFKVLEKAYFGQVFPLINEDTDWNQIDLGNGKVGWVANWLVTKVDSNASITKETGKIIVNNLRVRKEPSMDSEIIGIFNKDAQVNIIEMIDEWVKVETPSGPGFVAKKYLEMKEPLLPDSQLGNNLVILHDHTNIRANPDVSSKVMKKAQAGEVYPIIESLNNWYKIRMNNGEVGYVAGWIVSIQTSASSNEEHSLKNKMIVIDPGHGGIDKGATSLSGILEKKMTLQTAEALHKQLKEAGANVILTRSSDIFLSLPSRVDIATSKKADAFISLHFDSNLDSSVNGITSYYFHSFQKPLAIEIHSSLSQFTTIHDRGIRFGDYHVLRENDRKAILLELGYLSHPTEEKIITSTHYQELVSKAIFQGLEKYFKKYGN